MTSRPDPEREDLPPDLTPCEAELLASMARELEDSRPVPRPEFRGQLRRHLTAGGRRSRSWGRLRWEPLAASYAVLGAAMLGVAAIGLAGAGPFGA